MEVHHNINLKQVGVPHTVFHFLGSWVVGVPHTVDVDLLNLRRREVVNILVSIFILGCSKKKRMLLVIL
jgi:hypothetical protein